MGRIIAQATGFKEITASESDISPEGTIYVPEDTVLTVVDHHGQTSTGVIFLAGDHYVKFKKITSIEAGKKVYLKHAGGAPGYPGWHD